MLGSRIADEKERQQPEASAPRQRRLPGLPPLLDSYAAERKVRQRTWSSFATATIGVQLYLGVPSAPQTAIVLISSVEL